PRLAAAAMVPAATYYLPADRPGRPEERASGLHGGARSHRSGHRVELVDDGARRVGAEIESAADIDLRPDGGGDRMGAGDRERRRELRPSGPVKLVDLVPRRAAVGVAEGVAPPAGGGGGESVGEFGHEPGAAGPGVEPLIVEPRRPVL